MNSEVGSIVVLKNVIFKKSFKKNKNHIDHAYNTGRPAIVICQTDEKIYHLLLTHSRFQDEQMNDRYFPILDYKMNVNSFIDFNEIHSRPLCYEKEYEYINDEDLHDILVAFCTYQENYSEDEEYEEIRSYLYCLIKELSQGDEKSLKKEKK